MKQKQLQAIASSGLPKGTIKTLPTSAQYQAGQAGTTPAFISSGSNLTALPSTYGAPSITQLQNVAAQGPASNQGPALNMAGRPNIYGNLPSQSTPNQLLNVGTIVPQSLSGAGASQSSSGAGGSQSPSGVRSVQSGHDARMYSNTPFMLGGNPYDKLIRGSMTPPAGKDTPGFDLESLSLQTKMGNKIALADRDRLNALITNEKESGDRLRGHLDKMQDLEKEFPSRDNIKKRLKEQTNYGVAAAFFKAAGSKSPDFLTALSQGFGGAADVMQKMTGQEQKEMYKYAMDAYNREQQKANTQFKLDKNRSDEIYREKTLLQKAMNDTATLKLNYANTINTNHWKKLEMWQNLGKDEREAVKFNAEETNRLRDDRQAKIEDWGKTVNNYNEITNQMDILPEQGRLSYALETGYAEFYVPGAQMAINQGLKDLVKDLSKVDKQLRTQANPILDDAKRSAEAFRVLDKQYEDEPQQKVGSRQLMRQFGPELAEIANSQNPNLALKQLIKKYPYLDPETFTEALSP